MPAEAARQADAPADEQQQRNAFSMGGMVLQIAIMYFAMSMMQQRKASDPARPSAGGQAVRIANAWRQQQLFDLHVYASESADFDGFADPKALLHHRAGLAYAAGGALSSAEVNVTVAASPDLMANRSRVWAHVYVTAAGASADPASDRYDKLRVASVHHPLVKHLRAKKLKARKNLLSGEFSDNVTEATASEANARVESELTPHWMGTLPIGLVDDFSVYHGHNRIPPQARARPRGTHLLGPRSLTRPRVTMRLEARFHSCTCRRAPRAGARPPGDRQGERSLRPRRICQRGASLARLKLLLHSHIHPE